MTVARLDRVSRGLDAVGHLLRALHALRPGGWAVGGGRLGCSGSRSGLGVGVAADGASSGRSAGHFEGCTRTRLVARLEAISGLGSRAFQRRGCGLRTGIGDIAETRCHCRCSGLAGSTQAVGGRCATSERGPATGGSGGSACKGSATGCDRTHRGRTRCDHATGGETCADRSAGTELRTARDQAIGDAGTKNAEAEQ